MLVKRKTNGNVPMLSDMLENFFGNDLTNFFGTESQSTPAVNIRETKDSYNVDVAAPSLKKEDFKINLHNNILTISSEKEIKNEQKDENDRYTRREFSYMQFQRSFTLPDTAETEKIDAKYENGILCIKIPKKEMAITKSPKQIEVK